MIKVVYVGSKGPDQSESSIWPTWYRKDQSESRKFLAPKKDINYHRREILVFLPETPPILSEPIRHLSRTLVAKFGEEKGSITAEARTRNLWRTVPTHTPLDYRVSHTTIQGKFDYLCCNRKGNRPEACWNERWQEKAGFNGLIER